MTNHLKSGKSKKTVEYAFFILLVLFLFSNNIEPDSFSLQRLKPANIFLIIAKLQNISVLRSWIWLTIRRVKACLRPALWNFGNSYTPMLFGYTTPISRVDSFLIKILGLYNINRLIEFCDVRNHINFCDIEYFLITKAEWSRRLAGLADNQSFGVFLLNAPFSISIII